MLTAAGDSVVGRLHARGAHRETPALRAALEGRVRAADLRPQRLPPAAILIVRQVAVVPRVRLWSVGDRRWERACRDALGVAARRAARPLRGELPEDADAVLFRDEAELLACLALDLARGCAGRRWWWSVLLVRLGRAATSPEALLVSHAETAPAVLAELSAVQRAVEVLAALDGAVATTVLRALAIVHRAPALAEAAARFAVPNDSPGLESEDPEGEDPLTRATSAPREPGAGRVHRASGVREPAARKRSGAHAHDSAPGAPPAVSWEPRLRLLTEDRALGAPQRWLLGAALALHRRPEVARDAAFVAALRRWATAPSGAERPAARPAHGTIVEGPAVATQAEHESSSSPPAERSAPPEAEGTVRRSTAVPAPAAEPAPELGDGIATGLAGTFQLLNVMRRVELPEVCERELGSWEVLEALARGLLVEGDDPLWEVVRDLAGREPGEPLGAGCRPPRGWRPAAPAEGPLLAVLAPGARTWLAEALPRVRGWCALALDVAEDEVAAELLYRRGTLHVTRTHVDVVMALGDVSLAVRRAGLDADPGWDPRLGRIVRLHFREGGAR